MLSYIAFCHIFIALCRWDSAILTVGFRIFWFILTTNFARLSGFYCHFRVMSPSASGSFMLQMSERVHYSIFWFGFIREAFNFWCVQQLGCFLDFSLITIAVTVGFWYFFGILRNLRFDKILKSLVMKSIRCQILIQILHHAQCAIFRYWNQNNWNQFVIKFGHLPRIWCFS